MWLEFCVTLRFLAATFMRPRPFSALVASLLLVLGSGAQLHAQTYLYWYNSVSGGASLEVEPLDVDEVYDDQNPETTSYVNGNYEPAPNTYSMFYSSGLGSGISVNYSGSVSWTNPAFAYNYGNLGFSLGTDDQVRFVSTGGTGPISATFELVYSLSANRSHPVANGDADVEVNTSVRIRAKDGGNGGPVLWDFTAYRDLETYFGDGNPFDEESTNGASRFFTGTFTEDQLVTFQLNASTGIDVTSADASASVTAYLVLRDITDGFALQSASGVDYASVVPEPAGAAVLAGLAGLAVATLRRRGRRA